MKNGSVKKNAILNTIKSASSAIFPLITFPYVTRVLSVDEMGAFNFSASVVSYCLLFAGLGIFNYAVREGSQYRNDKRLMTSFVSDIYSINIISTVIVYLVLFTLLFTVTKLRNNAAAIIIMSSELLFTTMGANWLCNIYEDFAFIAVRTIAFQFFSLIAIFLFVKDQGDYYVYVIITTIALVGANFLNGIYVRRKYITFSFHLAESMKQHIKPILVIFASTITITLYVNSDVIILGFLLNDYYVGLYSTAVKIYTVVKNLLVAILAVLVPRFSILYTKGLLDEANELLQKTLNTISVLLVPAVVGLFLTSNDVILLIASEKYTNAGITLKILSVAIFFSLFAYLCTNCVLLPNKKESIILIVSIISAAVNIMLNFILIPIIGFNAAAYTTVIAEAIMCVCCTNYSRKFAKVNFFDRDNATIFISCIGIVMVCLSAGHIQSLLYRVIIEVCGSVLAYFLLMLLFKNSIITDYTHKMISRITEKKA